MKGIFDEHGILEALISDGGVNALLRNLRYSVRAMDSGTPSVLHTFQGPMDLMKDTGAELHPAMICYRATPVDHKLPSAAEMLYSRKYKTILPATTMYSNFTSCYALHQQ